MAEHGHEPQNIYDDPTFYAGYKALRQNDTGLNGAIEVPAMRKLLPDLAGLRILDLGCGFGYFARHARQSGASCVTAVDVSRSMLEEAARMTDAPAITYLHSSIEDYTPEPGSYDVVVSSLALHYVADYQAVVSRVYDALSSGGRFVFSVEHPVCTANPVGWAYDEKSSALHWPLDHYMREGRRDTVWFVKSVRKYHRTVATYVNTLIAEGFRLEHLGEPVPTPESLTSRPELGKEKRRPPFLLLAAARP